MDFHSYYKQHLTWIFFLMCKGRVGSWVLFKATTKIVHQGWGINMRTNGCQNESKLHSIWICASTSISNSKKPEWDTTVLNILNIQKKANDDLACLQVAEEWWQVTHTSLTLAGSPNKAQCELGVWKLQWYLLESVFLTRDAQWTDDGQHTICLLVY